MIIAGYLATILVGLSLGLMGSGGSILIMPILVYLFGIPPLLATSYSLFIVGATSLVGAYKNYVKGFVNIRTSLIFGISSVTTVFVTRKFLIPAIPNDIAAIGSLHITKALLTMVLFAGLMLLSASSMIRSRKAATDEDGPAKKENYPSLLLYGVGVGLVTGVLGAGGGFMLIPTLVLLVGMPMKKAIGTSLFIISLNALLGFTGDIGHFTFDWPLLFQLTAIAVAGIFAGSELAKKIPGAKLKTGFGWFVLVMGIYIIIKELFFK